jgi:8-oxo-dGTP pyrophosphatase MutT (NUDIX family)
MALNIAAEFDDARVMRDYALGSMERAQVDGLYGQTLNLSASQIEQQAKCRLHYFLRYGLRAQERKEAAVDPAEFGTYVHDVLENTCREIRDMGGFHAVSREETLEIAHRWSDKYAKEHFSQLDSQRVAYLFQRNMQELDAIVRELWEETGIRANPESFLSLGTRRDESGYFIDYYALEDHTPLDKIRLLPGETDAARWVSFSQMESMMAGGEVVEVIARRFLVDKQRLLRLQSV